MKEWYGRFDVCPPLNELMTGGFGDLEIPYSKSEAFNNNVRVGF